MKKVARRHYLEEQLRGDEKLKKLRSREEILAPRSVNHVAENAIEQRRINFYRTDRKGRRSGRSEPKEVPTRLCAEPSENSSPWSAERMESEVNTAKEVSIAMIGELVTEIWNVWRGRRGV